MSQDDLAAAIFVSRQTVSNWENDKTYPDVQSLVLLSQLFGISIDELIQGDVALMRRAMQEDSARMRNLSAAAVVMLALSVVFFIALAAAWRDPSPFGNLTRGELAGFAAFVPLYALSMVCALKIESIKHRHDLVSYREIMAFANGEPLGSETGGEGESSEGGREDHAFGRSHPIASRVMKFAAAAVAGAAAGLLIYKLIS